MQCFREGRRVLALDWCKGLPIENLARKSFVLHANLARALDGEARYVDTLAVQAEDQSQT
ncbi:hypothetical protein L0F63_000588, partial [Massospora cicadina]